MAKKQRREDYLPQSEREWIDFGGFETGYETVRGKNIRIAAKLPESDPGKLVVMVGGIPRSPERRKTLPLINKLYGRLAVLLARSGHMSLLYNQPATGLSEGNFNEDTLASRTADLSDLTILTARKHGVKRASFVGMSAGSYMAARATSLLESDTLAIEELVLQSPAAFPEAAEIVPYGEKFRQTLSRGWRISDSPVFEDIRDAATRGTRLAISYFQKDDPPHPFPYSGHIHRPCV